MAYSDYGSTTSVRPDRPLVVKATFDRWNKRITFSSARNCTFELLRGKVEQSFSLSASVFSIAYKDDDGEITDIASESDLTEAIQYFQNGVDDLPVSSAQSILSGRSFGGRKITLRVIVAVDYDGPSLSDTSSLASMDEYKNRNDSNLSLTFPVPVRSEPDDDSVTVSSRDTGIFVKTTKSNTKQSAKSSQLGSETSSLRSGTYLPPEVRFPEDPSAVFEQLRLANAGTSQFGSPNLGERSVQWLREQKSLTLNAMLGPTPAESDTDAMTVSDGFSLSQSVDKESGENLNGDLALKQDLRGRYYYSYTTSGSAASQSHDSGYDESIGQEASVGDHEEDCAPSHSQWKPNEQRLSISVDSCSYPSSSRHSDPFLTGSIMSEEGAIHPDIPPDLLQFMDTPTHPIECTDCSECGVMLDMIRYVCTSCGEKKPFERRNTLASDSEATLANSGSLLSSKGKARDIPHIDTGLMYPPETHRTPSSPASSSSSWVALSDAVSAAFNSNKPLPPRPLPLLPLPLPRSKSSFSNTDPATRQQSTASSSPSSSPSSSTLVRGLDVIAGGDETGIPPGYELCANCIQSAGVNHALQGNSGSGPESTPLSVGAAPPSPEEAQRTLSQWRRSAPKQKGHFRHAYVEKVWGPGGWKDVEQDEVEVCSTCESKFSSERYKCASCPKMVICRGCYSQVHEVHPMHPFLFVREPPPVQNEPEFSQFPHDDGLGETSMTHPGVVCTHCLQQIVGARFHCAICRSVDICSNCESAGLPGNLDAPDGGHNSSHIMLKIPIPIPSSQVESASRHALHLWRDRDEPNAQRSNPNSTGYRRQRAPSLQSVDARTVIGSGRSTQSRHGLGIGMPNGHGQNGKGDHQILCRGCSMNIVGVRYQCATCPSTAHMQYSLCSQCEPSSFILHDPMHVFFKLPRPIDCPIESQHPIVPILYKLPAGPRGVQVDPSDPKAYLLDVVHNAALCDQCMDTIQGEWYRCVYCAKDLCDVCEALDAHDARHFFYVFKSAVDMQLFRVFAELDNPGGSPPVLNYRVYYS